MSGGKEKKKSRAEGWEKADGEFYQERYPQNDIDFDVLPKDPSHIATLLPSKQNRQTTGKSMRRRRGSRAQTAGSSYRRQSCAQDVQVSMLPDLSDCHSNEQTTWMEIMQIKAMPMSMGLKREMKAKLQNSTHLRLQGLEHLKWKKEKILQNFKVRLTENLKKIELWKYNLKKIEGTHGYSVVSYFLLIKWLMYLNLFNFILIFFFLVFPSAYLGYFMDSSSNEFDLSKVFVDFIQGTGYMNKTLFFYGKYEHLNGYDLPLSYLLVILSVYLVDLFAIVRSASKGFKNRLIENEGVVYQYCNLIFSGWDFCIRSEKSAKIKHKGIHNEIVGFLQLKRLQEEKKLRTKQQKVKLLIIRGVVNVSITLILASGMFLTYVVFSKCQELLTVEDNEVLVFLWEFIPSLTITGLNIILPGLFKVLITYERYSPLFELRLTLLRTILLRLSGLVILVYSLSVEKDQVPCFENYFGRQFFKLFITDFATHIFLTFFINFPRSLIGRNLDNKFAKLVGVQEYDLSKNVLDVIYMQCIVWLGVFYCPFLPLIGGITYFFMFYLKKFGCLINSVPSQVIYKASKSNSLFMFVLLIGLFLSGVPVLLALSNFEPSACGPFVNHKTVWDYVNNELNRLPELAREVVYLLGSAWLMLPLFIVLMLALYYYSAVTAANRHMVEVLKHQLVLEGHDKQFLLNRLVEFSRQRGRMVGQRRVEQQDTLE